MKLDIPQFANKTDLHKWIVDNETLLLDAKKSAIKRADAIVHTPVLLVQLDVEKSAIPVPVENSTVLQVESAINSTNWLDSHEDVHIPSLWDKCLKETKSFYLVQEHQLKFDKIISDEVKAVTRQMSFKELGVDIAGMCEVLVFVSTVKEERNPFMFKQYKSGWVKNHSVGMRYVKLYTCLDSEEPWATQHKDNWDKYYPMIANKEAADERGVFWAVTEAKIIEGSAVPIGSNIATPTISVTGNKAATGTLHTPEPVSATQPKTAVNWDKVLSAFAN